MTPEQARADPKRLVIDANVPGNEQNGDVFANEDMLKDEGTVMNFVHAYTHKPYRCACAVRSARVGDER